MYQFLNKEIPMKPITLLFVLVLLGSCVSKKSYDELQETVGYYKEQATVTDSLNNATRNAELEKQEIEVDLKAAMMEIEQLTATNKSLYGSYQEMLSKYNSLINQNREVLSATSYENLNLQEAVAQKQDQLDQKERALLQMEYDLQQERDRLRTAEYNYTAAQGNLNAKDRRIQELEASLQANERTMNQLRNSMNEVLRGFSSDELSAVERNGKMYLSLSQNLLFSSGSNEIDWKGRQALMKVAEALKGNPDIDITVEGHTDSDGTASKNWDLSVLRATTVVKLLASYGVPSDRLTAAGRGFYAPVASNDTRDGKGLNRRTEIVLSPQLDQLYNLIRQ